MTSKFKSIYSALLGLMFFWGLMGLIFQPVPALAGSGLTLSLNDNTVVTSKTPVLSGTVSSDYSANLTVNGLPVAVSPQGSWSVTLNLSEGTNTIEVRASGTSGTTSQSIQLISATVAPYITITDPDSSNYAVSTDFKDVKASVFNSDKCEVLVNGDIVASSSSSNVSGGVDVLATASGLKPGNNVVTFKAIKSGSNGSNDITVTKSVVLVYDDTPILRITSPSNGSNVDVNHVTPTLEVANATQLEFYLNGIKKETLDTPPYSYDFTALQPGNNTLEVRAINGSKTTTKSIIVTYQPQEPVVYGLNQPLTGAVSYNGTLELSGMVQHADKLTIETVTGTNLCQPLTFLADENEDHFSQPITLPQGFSGDIWLTPSQGGVDGQTLVLKDVSWQKGSRLALELPVSTPASDDFLSSKVYPDLTVLDNKVRLKGTAENATEVTLKLAGQNRSLDLRSFDVQVDLVAGTNQLVIEAKNNSVTITKTVKVTYSLGPLLNIVSPTLTNNTANVTQSKVTIIGTATRIKANGVTVTLTDGEAVVTTYHPDVDTQGNFSQVLYLKSGTTNEVQIDATDGLATSSRTITLNYHNTPVITIKSPKNGTKVTSNKVTVTGTVWNTETGGLSINGNQVSFGSTGEFSYQALIPDRNNTVITIRASNRGLTVSQDVYFEYGGSAEIMFTSHSDQDTVYSNIVTIKGRLLGVEKPYSDNILKLNNVETSVDDDGYFSQTVTLKKGTNTISVSGKLTTGNVSKSIKLIYNDLPFEGAHLEVTPKSTATNLKLFGDAVTLAIPAAAFNGSQTVDISIESSADVDKDSADIIYASKIYEIDCYDPESPIGLSLKYIEGLRDALTNKLAIYQYDDGEWVSLGGKVDAKKRTVTAQINGGGTYAVMASVASFSDMSGHWAQDDVEILTAKGVLSGRGGGNFKPQASVTRAEFAKMLVKALNIPIYDEQDPSFNDVSEDDWEYEYVQAALRAGLIKGIGGRHFHPDDSVSRIDAAIMLARAANLKQATDSEITSAFKGFRDQKSITYGQREVAAAVKAGFIKGITPTTFNPSQNTTRAQSAKLLVRLMITQKKM